MVNKYILNILLTFVLIFSINSAASSDTVSENLIDTDSTINVVYLDGIGCHNCAVVDPIIFTKATKENPRLIVYEYEIYRDGPENKEVKDKYFSTYYKQGRGGVPFLIFNRERNFMGRIDVLKGLNGLGEIKSNPFPLPMGSGIKFQNLDVSKLEGKIKIWTKNRVLISGEKGNNSDIQKVLLAKDLTKALESLDYKETVPNPIAISGGEINFEYAVKLEDWTLQWNGAPLTVKGKFRLPENLMAWILISIIAIGFIMSIFEIKISKDKLSCRFRLEGKLKDTLIAGGAFLLLIIFFFFAKNVSPQSLENSGYIMPLPFFTFLIAIVDGFNPCNMFVLTCLLSLLIATSDSKKRLYVVALSFISMVFLIYFLFMAAWLNVFKYLSFVTPIRYAIAVLALVAGFINCKEILFFKKGVSLMIPESQQGPLMKKIESMKEIIRSGSMPILVASSLGLAALSSFIELPCTAGFPIIYTNILSGKNLEGGMGYYFYLILYNLVYVIPLLVIVTFFIYTLRAKRISQRQVEIIKFIGGLIMILLGIILLVNPGIVGLSIG